MKEYQELLIKKYEAFEDEQNEQKKILLRFKVINILQSHMDDLDSDDMHIWGLVYYMSDDDKEYHKPLALEKFLSAYEMDDSNFLACLYIAHCYHDTKDYMEALKYYMLVNQDDLKDFMLWRYVKLIEQIGFCLHKLGKTKKAEDKFLQVLNWYKMIPYDSTDLAIPQEIFECLPEDDNIVIELKKLITF